VGRRAYLFSPARCCPRTKRSRNGASSCLALCRESTPFLSKQDVDGRDKPGHDAILNSSDQTAPLIHCSSFCFGAAPTWREASWPSLKIIKVGIDMTPYLVAVAGFSSTLSLRIFTLPFIAPEISSSAGAIMRQGPHHSAQKSTTTGSADLSTCDA